MKALNLEAVIAANNRVNAPLLKEALRDLGELRAAGVKGSAYSLALPFSRITSGMTAADQPMKLRLAR